MGTASFWNVVTRPNDLAAFLFRQTTKRKVMLWGCACCRRVASLESRLLLPWIIECAEQIADGRGNFAEFLATAEVVERAQRERPEVEVFETLLLEGVKAVGHGVYLQTSYIFRTGLFRLAASVAQQVVPGAQWVIPNPSIDDADRGVPTDEEWQRIWRFEEQEQVSLARDIWGGIHSDASIPPGWLTSTVTGLAREIYDGRAFDQLPILADALQDVGCDSDDLLSHCRSNSVHSRGCWALDAVLGRG